MDIVLLRVDEFRNLCNEFLLALQPRMDTLTLQNLKAKYAERIGSARKLSRVKDLPMFLKTLEKLDILSCDDTDPLWHIIEKYDNFSDLKLKLLAYGASMQRIDEPPPYNMYRNHIACTDVNSKSSIRVATSAKGFERSKYTKNSLSPVGEAAMKGIVLRHVNERLGRSWRDVARHLGIRESEIDFIQNKYPFDLKEQGYQILQMYLTGCTSPDWKISLLRALEKARRRDLKELMEELVLQKKCA